MSKRDLGIMIGGPYEGQNRVVGRKIDQVVYGIEQEHLYARTDEITELERGTAVVFRYAGTPEKKLA